MIHLEGQDTLRRKMGDRLHYYVSFNYVLFNRNLLNKRLRVADHEHRSN